MKTGVYFRFQPLNGLLWSSMEDDLSRGKNKMKGRVLSLDLRETDDQNSTYGLF